MFERAFQRQTILKQLPRNLLRRDFQPFALPLLDSRSLS
jgi:hypothetical protein